MCSHLWHNHAMPMRGAYLHSTTPYLQLCEPCPNTYWVHTARQRVGWKWPPARHAYPTRYVLDTATRVVQLWRGGVGEST